MTRATARALACAGQAAAVLRDSPPTEGFAPEEVWAEGDDVLVALRWRSDPHVFVVRRGSWGGRGTSLTPKDWGLPRAGGPPPGRRLDTAFVEEPTEGGA